jgi:hypothetical protein
MNKTLTILLVAFTMIGCSSSDNLEDPSNLILGKWNFEAQISENGTNINLDECQKRSNITFNTNTFDTEYYETNNNNQCALVDEDKNVEYNLKGDILEITSKYSDNSGQQYIDVREIGILFTDENTMEIFEIDRDGNNQNDKSTYKRYN